MITVTPIRISKSGAEELRAGGSTPPGAQSGQQNIPRCVQHHELNRTHML